MPSAAKPRRVVMLAYPDAQVLDVVGALEVFNGADTAVRAAAALGAKPGAAAYTTEIVAPCAGPFATSGSISIVADTSLDGFRGEIDTLLIAGGTGSERAAHDPAILAWIKRHAPRARRLASVCSGAQLLAEAGLLDGKHATTHWAYAQRFAETYPRVTVDPDAVFVRDGNVYTSAGVTTGMDLALALVEEDHGRETALLVAQWLVLFLKRPGGQSQFSVHLHSQLPNHEPIRDSQAWLLEHLNEDLSVERLAHRAAMSPRNFSRVFAREAGTTPARFVERARIEAARRQLEQSSAGVEEVAARCGFANAETMRRAFLRIVRVSPSAYRSRFQSRLDIDAADAPCVAPDQRR